MVSSSFGWRQLHMPSLISEESARAALQALAGLAGQPRVVLEAVGANHEVSWRVGAEYAQLSRVTHVLQAHIHDLRVEPLGSLAPARWRVDLAATARFAGDSKLPLRHDVTPSVVRGVVAALAGAGRSETLRVQLVLGPRSRPVRAMASSNGTRTDVTGIRKKAAEYTFGCTLRIAARADDTARARSLVNQVAAALRGLEVPGASLRLKRVASDTVMRADSPFLWTNALSVSDLLALTAWPINDAPLPGVPAAHPRLLPPTPGLPKSGRSVGLATTSLRAGTERTVALKDEDALRHLHVLGPTGSGKSQTLGGIAIASMQANKSLVVVDPKGVLVDDLIARIPADRVDDVIIIDPFDDAPVGLNGLRGGVDADRSADAMLAVFHSLYSDSWGPRTHDILHASLLTLARRGDASLVMVPLLLTNPGFRRSVIGRIVAADPLGIGSFWSWYESLSDAERQHAIAPLMNKLRPILLRPGLRAIFGQRRPRFDLRELFVRPRIVLVPLDKGRLGPEAADLLGSLVVAQLWDAAREQSRQSNRCHVDLVIDEVQDFLRLSDVGEALAQARSMGLALTAANQHLGQFTPTMREAFLTNARSRVMFQQNLRDARELAPLSRGQVAVDDLLALPAFHAYASLLVDGTSAPWVSLSTQLMPPPTTDPDLVRRTARERYGRPLSEVEADLLSLAGATPEHPRTGRIGRMPITPSQTEEDS